MRILNRLVFLFTSFHGRIGRKTWWAGFSLLITISTTIGLLTNPPAFDGQTIEAAKPPLWLTLLSLVMFVPMLALTVKRLNDRDQPGWVRYIFGALGVSSVLTPYFAPFAEPQKLSTAEWAILAIPALIGFWFFIDNGFLKGTPGPNRYGLDPLDPTSGSGTGGPMPPVPARTGRTRGAWVRDGLVGVLSCIVAAFLLLPGLSIDGAVKWSMENILMPDMRHFTLGNDMRANAPAWKAFTDGTEAARSDDFEAAVQHLNRAIELYGPDNDTASRPYYHRAYALRALGRPEEALESDNNAIRLGPITQSNYFSRAKSYRALGKYRDALADYDRALNEDPDEGDYHMGRGAMLEELGRTDDAFEAYANAIDAAEKDYEHWVKFYDEHQELSKPEESERLRRERRRIKAWAHAEIGRIQNDRGDRDKALEELNTAIRLSPDYRNAYMNRGWVYEKQGRIDKARADYERAAELGEPDDWLKRALERVRQ